MLFFQTMIISMRMSLKLQLQHLISKEMILVGILILEPLDMKVGPENILIAYKFVVVILK